MAGIRSSSSKFLSHFEIHRLYDRFFMRLVNKHSPSQQSNENKMFHSTTLDVTVTSATVSNCFFSKCYSDSNGCIRLEEAIVSLTIKRCIFTRCVATSTHTDFYVLSCAAFCFTGETCTVSRICFDRCKGVGRASSFFSRCTSDSVLELSAIVNPDEPMPHTFCVFLLDCGQQALSHTNTSQGDIGGHGVGGVIDRGDNATLSYSQFVHGTSRATYAIGFGITSSEVARMSFCNIVDMEAPLMLFSAHSGNLVSMTNIVAIDCRAPKFVSTYGNIFVTPLELTECVSNVRFELQPTILPIDPSPSLADIDQTWYPCPPFTQRQLPTSRKIVIFSQHIMIQY